VQKLLLAELEEAQAECEVITAYVGRFHEADKRAAVLEERLNRDTALEIGFGVGLSAGGAIIGLAPLFWSASEQPKGWLALIIGVLLVVGATVMRVVKR
jgi:hypothetical protein